MVFGQLGDLALRLKDELALEIAVRDIRHDFVDTADLGREIRGHRIDIVGQILPCAGHAADFRLATELAFRADLTRHAGYFRREPVELINHGVDRVLQLQKFAVHVHRDLAGQIASRHRRGHLRDVADLRG